jgi:8-oxo-dGTP pyrophosphatase MutT (NUDIX family)
VLPFDGLRELLVPLPGELPRPPRALAPTLLPGPRGEAPRFAGSGRATRDGACLVLLYPGPDGDAHVLLTERPTGDLRHAGEISFPGGAVDPDDVDATAAALREAREEVGLDARAAGVEILGLLEPVEIPVSGFRLIPVLAVAVRRPEVVPDPREVAAILEVPLAHFLAAAPIEIVETEVAGRRIRYGAYPVGGHLVWGATARALGQLGALLSLRMGERDGATSDAATPAT